MLGVGSHHRIVIIVYYFPVRCKARKRRMEVNQTLMNLAQTYPKHGATARSKTGKEISKQCQEANNKKIRLLLSNVRTECN